VSAAFGDADWDISVLAEPRVVNADPSGLSGPLAVTAAEGLAALHAADTIAARTAARVLGPAGVVAVRDPAGVVEVHETIDGWQLVAAAVPTPDLGDLAGAATVRAVRLAEARRAPKART
jgi:hypothetical protein